jgi:translation elongation factor EF-4
MLFLFLFFWQLLIIYSDFLIPRYKESELLKLDIQINGEHVEPLATIVHKDKVILVLFKS